jgi:GNAT superfamily N-acetyltransferase
MLKKANLKDIEELSQIFFTELKNHPSYISHGEMQMGITNSKGAILEGAEERWKKYARRKIMNRNHLYPSLVLKYEKMHHILAFGIFSITNDENDKFGVVCDIIVRRLHRRHGLGTQLLEEGLKWFYSFGIKDIYLESGLGNQSAHAFFEKHKFKKTSYVLKLQN